MMVMVALTGVLSAAVIDRARRGSRLIDLGYIRFVENEPLVNPTKVRAINGDLVFLEGGYVGGIDSARLVLEDGREVLIEEGPLLQAAAVLEDPSERNCVVEVQTDVDGTATVFKKQRRWFCGTCLYGSTPLIRIPLFPRTINLNSRVLVGTGRITRGDDSVPMGDRPGHAT
jgi:hypothetical protein